MSVADLGSLGEFIASLAVLVTLVYLAIQVRQANRLTRSQARQSMLLAGQNELYKFVEDPQLFLSLADAPTTPVERAKLGAFLTANLRQREFDWMQYRDGIIDADTYKAYADVINVVLGARSARKWWDTIGPTAFHPEFVQEVNARLDEVPAVNWYQRTIDLE